MKFTITSAQRDIFGQYEINVKINGRLYKYYLSSEYAYDKAMKQYQAGQHGRCLAVLNKFGKSGQNMNTHYVYKAKNTTERRKVILGFIIQEQMLITSINF